MEINEIETKITVEKINEMKNRLLGKMYITGKALATLLKTKQNKTNKQTKKKKQRKSLK